MLREIDEAILKEKGYSFDVSDENKFTCIVIHEYPFPPVYTPRSADLLIRLPNGFPTAKPDMFWTLPNVTLTTGGFPHQCAHFETYLGKSWQRWSRHWITPWRPGRDGLHTFLAAISSDIARGI